MFMVQEIEIDKIEIGAGTTAPWPHGHKRFPNQTHQTVDHSAPSRVQQQRRQLCMKPNEHRFNMPLFKRLTRMLASIAEPSVHCARASVCVGVRIRYLMKLLNL